MLVSLEIIKYGQAYFITNDLSLYDEEKDKQCNVQSSGLNEELGQISAIFSDKTGTLTCNIMNFKKICIDGINYGVDDTASHDKRILIDNVNFADDKIEILKNPNKCKDKKHSEYINKTIMHLACCHSLLVIDQDTCDINKIKYSASSPDELALGNFANALGCVFY